MISSRFANNLYGWRDYANMSRRQQAKFCKRMKIGHVKDMEELFYNILHGNVRLDSSTLERMKRHKRKAKLIGQRRVPLRQKRQLIQTGNGPALVSLALSVLPVLLELLQ